MASDLSESEDEPFGFIVIDNGSSFTEGMQAGFAGEGVPSTVLPTVTAVLDRGAQMHTNQRTIVGDEAVSKIGISTLSCPIKRGVIDDWDNMNAIWHHIFYNDLKIQPSEHSVLMTERILNPFSNRSKMMESMFEIYGCRGFNVEYKAILSCYAHSRSTGMMTQIGDGVTSIVPIYEGSLIQHAVKRVDIGGSDINEYLMELLADSNKNINFGRNPTLIVSDIKEKVCAVSADGNIQNVESIRYTLPDGQIIEIGSEQVAVNELLFDHGIHEMVHESIMKCDMCIRSDFCSNICLAGGVSLTSGFCNRMANEIDKLVPHNSRFRIVAHLDRKYMPWIGGSIIGSLSTYREIAKSEYEEHGTSILLRKNDSYALMNPEEPTVSFRSFRDIERQKKNEKKCVIDGYVRQCVDAHDEMINCLDESVRDRIWKYVGNDFSFSFNPLHSVQKENDDLMLLVNTSENKLKNLQLRIDRLQKKHFDDEAKMKQSVKYIKLQERNNEIEQRTNGLMKSIVKLKNENNSLSLQYDNALSQYKTLKNDIKSEQLDISEYKSWSRQQVLEWILSLDDGRFIKYDNLLALKFEEQQFDGSCLDDVDAEELEMWNIKSESDRNSLLHHIKLLIH